MIQIYMYTYGWLEPLALAFRENDCLKARRNLSEKGGGGSGFGGLRYPFIRYLLTGPFAEPSHTNHL